MVITNLSERIKKIYPELTWDDFRMNIIVQNDGNGKSDFIREWNHPTLVQPTNEQIELVNN